MRLLALLLTVAATLVVALDTPRHDAAAAQAATAHAAATTGGRTAAGDLADGDCLRHVRGIDLQTATIGDLQRAMAAGRLTSAELVDAYLARIEAYDRTGAKLNSIRELDPDARRVAAALDAERRAGEARGPLHGIPVLLKDNVAAAGLPLTAGSIALEGARPKRDATITQRLRDAGAVILGKANLSEFAGWVSLSMPPGYSSLAGQVRNAHHFGDPSGSSAGSGVAASMAFAAATIGTETSGSILSPSNANGVVGVKTTLGLVSRAGILPLSPEFDVPGPMVRSTEDAAVVLDAIAGTDPRDAATAGADASLPAGGYAAAIAKAAPLEGARIAYSKRARADLSAARRAIFDTGLAKLAELGATTVGVDALDGQAVGLAEIGAIPNDFKWSLNAFLTDEMTGLDKARSLTQIIAHNKQHPGRMKYGQSLLEASDATPGLRPLALAQAAPARAAARAVIDAALAEGDADAILVPGNAHANVGAAAGYPTALIPAGYTDEVRPFGFGFLGQAYTEDRLLAYAHALEQATRARRAPTEINEDLGPAAACATGTAWATLAQGGPTTRAARRAARRGAAARRTNAAHRAANRRAAARR